MLKELSLKPLKMILPFMQSIPISITLSNGVNWKIAEKLGLSNVKVLSPKKQLLTKLTFFAPC